MRLTYKAVVRTPEIRNLRRHAPQALQKALRTTLVAMEVTAKQQAPVDTGALRASIHIVLWTSSGIGHANSMAAMMASRKGRKLRFGPGRRVKTPWEGWLSTAVNYAPYQEQLRFFMRAAAADGRRRLKREVEHAIRAAKRGSE